MMTSSRVVRVADGARVAVPVPVAAQLLVVAGVGAARQPLQMVIRLTLKNMIKIAC